MLTGSRRQTGGIAAHCPAVYQGRILSTPPLRGVLRCVRLGIVDSGSLQLRAARPGRPDARSDCEIPKRPQSRPARGAGRRKLVPEGSSYQGNPHIVAQWADLHNSLAQAWVNGGPDARRVRGRLGEGASGPRSQVDQGQSRHSRAQGRRSGRRVLRELLQGEPRQISLRRHRNGADGKTQTTIEPVKEGSDIQSIFF